MPGIAKLFSVGRVGRTVSGRNVVLARAITVGPDDRVPRTRCGHDLDNYPFPAVRALGPGRFAAVCARKLHAPSSAIAITAWWSTV
ncbi:hypothetical protein ACFW3D_23610 [Streptomyces sp. NPDC058864]